MQAIATVLLHKPTACMVGSRPFAYHVLGRMMAHGVRSFFLSFFIFFFLFLFSLCALCSGAQLVRYLVGLLQVGGGAASEYSVPCFGRNCGICWDDGTNPTC